jgi:malonyl-CoA O-methyltransferase
VSALEDRLVGALSLDVAGRRLLDVGCGVGRRLPGAGVRLAVGVDLVPEMLMAGRRAGSRRLLAAGDVRFLPVASAAFDLVWCRLVLGHLPDLVEAYAELTRVGRPGADLVVSDFHPAAVAAGHKRTFVDADGTVREVEHWVHAPDAHVEVAGARGWKLVQRIDAPAGRPERPFYERAGRLAQFEAEAALPLVLILRFRR